MKKAFYPNSIVQIIAIFLFTAILSSPIIFFLDKYQGDIKQVVFFLFFGTIFLLLVYIINKRNKVKFSLNIKLLGSRQNFFLIAVVFVFELGINLPVNSFLNFAKPYSLPTMGVILGAIFLAPIIEEIIFRGVILRGLLTRYSAKKAIIISALLFGLVHGQLFMIFPAIIIGLFFGWIYYKTKSVGTTMLLHATTNFVVIFGNFLLHKISQNIELEFFVIIKIIVIAISLMLLTYLIKHLIKNNIIEQT